MSSAELGSAVGTATRGPSPGPQEQSEVHHDCLPRDRQDRVRSGHGAHRSAGAHLLPEIEPEPSGPLERILVGVFVGIPLLALLAAIPLACGLGLAGLA